MVAASALLVGGAAAQAPPTPPRELVGVWQMDGQAEILDLTASEVTYFDATAVSCIETDRRPAAHFAQRFPARVANPARAAVVVHDRTGEPYTLRRLGGLPERCRNGGTVGEDPVLNFEVFWHYFAENYANSEARGVDWDALYREFRPRVSATTTPAELWGIYDEVFHRFDDVHVFVTNGQQGDANQSLSAGRPSGLRAALIRQNPSLSEDQGSALDSELSRSLNHVVLYDVLGGRFSSALQDKFQWGWAAPGIGYLNIQAMYGLFNPPATDPAQVAAAVEDVMARVLSDFSGARALIIDIRQNRGGSDLVARTVASYLVERPLSMSTRARAGAGYTPWFAVRTEPAQQSFEEPVYLLISDNTVSAGESLAALMAASPNVTLVGTRTRGAFSSFTIKALPNGAYVAISNYQTRGPGGEDYEANGVAPDIEVASYCAERLIAGYRDAINLAVQLATHDDEGAHQADANHTSSADCR